MSIPKKPWRWIFLGMTILWMVFIFGMSSATAEASNVASGRLVTFIQKNFFPDWESFSEADYLAMMGRMSFFIRKAAHITEFAVLGGLVSLIWMTFGRSFGFRFAVSFLISLLYAATDELHQRFVSGRSGSLFDVLVDTAGIFIGCILVLGLFAMIAEDRKRKERLREAAQNE